MNIRFESLRNCYVVFVPWSRLVSRFAEWTGWKRAAPGVLHPASQARPLATAALGGLLVAGNLWAGATRAVEAWPLACYPPFDGLSQDHLRTLRIHVTMADGSERTLAADDYRDTFGNRWNNLMQRILNNRDEAKRAKQLTLVWNVLAHNAKWVLDARQVRFVSSRVFVDPARWKAPDDIRVLLETPVQVDRGVAR